MEWPTASAAPSSGTRRTWPDDAHAGPGRKSRPGPRGQLTPLPAKETRNVLMEWRIQDYYPPSAWLRPMLDALTEVNRVYLRARPETPLLYAAGVRYKRDPSGRENWRDIPQVRCDGVGDCKKLAAWRAAELQERFGVQAIALPVMQESHPGSDVLLVHVVVQFPDGTTEDPSRILGM